MAAIGGMLKIRVIRGRDLVIRDLFSSDPYVRLRIGEHEVKTHVKENNLNPYWDEELTLATPDPPIPLKLIVLDKDMFSADDRMGDAQIDLQPLIGVAKRNDGSRILQDGLLLRTIVATRANGFAKDSVIKFKNGQIVQEVCMKLQNVEKGEIELELRWRPYSP